MEQLMKEEMPTSGGYGAINTRVSPMDNKGIHPDLELASMGSTDDYLNDKRLPTAEAELLRIVKAGEVDELFEHLRMNPTVNVNVIDYRGLTPLSIAVRAEQTDMVDALLVHKDIHLEDAMLHAVTGHNVPIMERLLSWRERAALQGVNVDGLFESSDFPSYMTPLMLACHNNDYELVRLLLRHGFTLTEDNMGDYAASNEAVGETLEMGRARIDNYRAHASSVYMCLTDDDPLYKAFLYARAAEKLAYCDPIFKDDYEALSDSCKRFAVQVLDECRTTEEVRVLLAQPHDYKETEVASSGVYPRLDLAIAFEMKDFIVHKNCQQVLQNIWTLEHPNIMWMPMALRILYFIPHLLVLPFVYLLYFFAPCARFLDYWKAPMNKFLGDMVSYFTFIGLLFYTIVNSDLSVQALKTRTPTINNGVDVVLWVWILSYLWDHVKLWYFSGVKAYVKDWWNIYSLAMTLVFLTSIAAKGASFFFVLRYGATYETENRDYWNWDDPMLVSEAFYSFGVILAFGRVLQLFLVSQILGPLQLSLGKMMTDMMQMLTFMMLTIFAFAAGISRLYIYYAGAVRISGNTTETQPEYFQDFQMTFRTLFWDLFGFGGRDDPNLFVNNKCANGTGLCPPVAKEHVLTENMGFVMYGLFHLIVITTMLNMLIAMMGNSMNSVMENSDREWKFARSRLWVSYFDRASVLPNPFNMIPTPYDIWMMIRWVLSCRSDDEEAGWDRNMCCYRIDSDERRQQKLDQEKYKVLLISLMKRFLSQIDGDEEKETVTPEMLELAKLELIKEIYRASTGNDTTVGRSSSRYGRRIPSPAIYEGGVKATGANGVPSAYI